MTKSLSFAVLALVAAGLTGCATTDSPQDATAASSSSSTSSTSSTSTGSRSGSNVGGGKVGNNAVPPVGQSPDLKRSVFYEFDKYDVKPEYRSLVESHARWLKANPGARLTIEGNADEQGSREYNLALGQRRAESVSKLMMLLGVKGDQLEAISYGEERPRSNAHDEKGWAENRRSDFARR
jgi:peptidoglycan-associated lipoprotein